MKLKLFTIPGACSLSDHIVLNWSALPYEVEAMDHQKIKTPEFLKVNPAGAVPALLVDGIPLLQNIAILNFIADLAPEAKLTGDGTPRSRAEVNQWLGFINADVHPTYKPLFGGMAFLEDDAAIKKTQDDAKKHLRTYYERLDKQLAGKDWLVGTRSIVDAYLFVTLLWAKAVHLDMSGLSNLERFTAKMLEDEGVKNAMKFK